MIRIDVNINDDNTIDIIIKIKIQATGDGVTGAAAVRPEVSQLQLPPAVVAALGANHRVLVARDGHLTAESLAAPRLSGDALAQVRIA